MPIQPEAKAALDAGAAMDEMYRYQRYIYDLTRSYYLLGRDGLIADLRPPQGGTVLEIGCGTGRNLIDVARRYSSVRCYGLDISAVMLDTARAAANRAGVSDRIVLARADATGFDPEALFNVAAFDRVFLSYTLSMIPAWPDAIRAGLAAMVPGGAMHIVDFGNQERLPGWFRAGLFAWLVRFGVHPRADLAEVAGSLAQERGLTSQPRHLFRGYAQSVVIAQKRVS